MLKGRIILENGIWYFRMDDGEQYVFFSDLVTEEHNGCSASATFTNSYTPNTRMGIVVLEFVEESTLQEAERWDGLS